MPISPYDEVLSRAQRLSPEEQIQLIEALAALVHREIAREHAQPDVPATPQVEEVVEGYDPATDPLARFAGFYAGDEPGWMNRHDEAFGALGDEDAQE